MLARFLQQIPLQASDSVLIFSAEPQTAGQIAARAGRIVVHEVDYAARELLRADKGLSDRIDIAAQVFPTSEGAFDQAIIVSPKGRAFARALLWSAYRSLKPGGTVYLIGGNAEGIKSLIADAAQLFDYSRTLDKKQRQRLGVAVKGAQDRDWPLEWGDLPTEIQQRRFETALGAVEVGTLPGVFSWAELDAGTALLLEQPALHDAARDAAVLDLGCGNGIIGCALSPLVREVDLSDVNLLAIDCARVSASLNASEKIRVYPGDVYSAVGDKRFDLIVSNPPFHKGFDTNADIVQRIIGAAPDHLRPGGQLVLVANAFLPYEPLLEKHLAGVETLARNKRFKVLAARL